MDTDTRDTPFDLDTQRDKHTSCQRLVNLNSSAGEWSRDMPVKSVHNGVEGVAVPNRSPIMLFLSVFHSRCLCERTDLCYYKCYSR